MSDDIDYKMGSTQRVKDPETGKTKMSPRLLADLETADLAEKYPGAKVTRAGEQSRPEGGSANRLADYEMDSPGRADRRSLEPYEAKAAKAKFTRSGGSGSSGTLPNDKGGLDRPHLYKKGGKVAGKLATRGYGKAR